jgi:hypothetical protein
MMLILVLLSVKESSVMVDYCLDCVISNGMNVQSFDNIEVLLLIGGCYEELY